MLTDPANEENYYLAEFNTEYDLLPVLFDLKESHKSLYGMFRHCSLSYNDSSYNSALINSAYYNVDISSFYTLNNTTIDLIKDFFYNILTYTFVSNFHYIC